MFTLVSVTGRCSQNEGAVTDLFSHVVFPHSTETQLVLPLVDPTSLKGHLVKSTELHIDVLLHYITVYKVTGPTYCIKVLLLHYLVSSFSEFIFFYLIVYCVFN